MWHQSKTASKWETPSILCSMPSQDGAGRHSCLSSKSAELRRDGRKVQLTGQANWDVEDMETVSSCLCLSISTEECTENRGSRDAQPSSPASRLFSETRG